MADELLVRERFDAIVSLELPREICRLTISLCNWEVPALCMVMFGGELAILYNSSAPCALAIEGWCRDTLLPRRVDGFLLDAWETPRSTVILA